MRTTANNHADMLFLQSTDGGTNWLTTTNGGATWTTNVLRVNADGTTNDQWMPAVVVRPDGNMLFVGWLDRRNDPNNSLIDAYGRWGTIATNGAVTLSTNDFRITTQSFPPAFAGSLPENTNNGYYDPVWPPGGVNLRWWYTNWWPEPDPDFPEDNRTYSTYAREMGEHMGASADMRHVYLVWSDNRSGSQGTLYPARRQADICLARLPWPAP